MVPDRRATSPTFGDSVEKMRVRLATAQWQTHEQKRTLRGLTKHVEECWVLDPRTVAFVGRWDLMTSIALLYVALVTPVEV